MYAKFGQDVGTMPETDEEEESRLNKYAGVCAAVTYSKIMITS